MVNRECLRMDPDTVTEGDIRAPYNYLRAANRSMVGYSMGPEVKSNRRTVSRYVGAQTGMGDLKMRHARLSRCSKIYNLYAEGGIELSNHLPL